MLGPRRLAGLMRRFCIGQQDVGEDHWRVRGVSPRASLTVTVCGLGSPPISTPLVACGEGAELLRKVPLAALGSSREAPYRSLNISSQCGHWPEEPSQSRPRSRGPAWHPIGDPGVDLQMQARSLQDLPQDETSDLPAPTETQGVDQGVWRPILPAHEVLLVGYLRHGWFLFTDEAPAGEAWGSVLRPLGTHARYRSGETEHGFGALVHTLLRGHTGQDWGNRL
ncbi:uncharacterized protein [Manis javanica]|uniref:uncharacterized protein isoform X2 n=1 Tax=Manis javanica TaxID=9974 RepID=UPI003C6CC56C